MQESYQVCMSVNDVEDKIRYATQMRYARTDEYLKDFDRLRSGYVTSKFITLLYVHVSVWLWMYGYACMAMYVWLCMYGYV